MFFLHIFYVHSWIVSLITYCIVYLEIIVVIYINYGPKFVAESPLVATLDILFYIILFGTYVSFTVLAFRTYEMKERADFFAELQTRNEMEEWKSLLSGLPLSILLVVGGKIKYCNAEAYSLFTHSRNEQSEEVMLEKLNLVKEIGQSDRTLAEYIKGNADLPVNGSSVSFVYQAEESQKKLEVKCVEIKQKNGTVIKEYITHDVTTIKDLEFEKAQNQCLQILVTTATHDIRTPINAIQGVYELLAPYIHDKEGREQLQIGQASVKKMLFYVQGLSYLKQFPSKTLQIEKKMFEAPLVANEMLGHFDFQLREKKIQISVRSLTHIPPMFSDKDKYETIIYYLLENSVKYTIKGEINIKLSFNSAENYLVTQILDTGVGISKEQKQYLFKLFEEKHEKDQLNKQGIGIGLYIAKQLSIELGGDLKITSQEGIGTTVTFTIKQDEQGCVPTVPMTETDILLEPPAEGVIVPVPSMSTRVGAFASDNAIFQEEDKKASERDPLVSARKPPSPPSKIPKKKKIDCGCNKILIVDDEVFNIYILKKFLKKIHLEVDSAVNGQVALDAILQRKAACDICQGYKIVLMDINMPVMNGITATEKIKEYIKDGTIPETIVIAVTAAAYLEDRVIYAKYQKIGFRLIRKA